MAPKFKTRGEKERTPKRALVLLPLVHSPTPMSNGYGELNWTNIFHLDPGHWGIIKQIVFQTPGGGDMVLCDLMNVCLLGG